MQRGTYYQAMLEALDTEIGRVLAAIPSEDSDNTYVIFLGDNGTPNQVTRELSADHGAKDTIYDSGTRVPLIVTGPGIDPGRSTDFVNTTDIHTTIAALAGAVVAAQNSMEFNPVLTGGNGARDYIYVEHFTQRTTRGGGIYGWSMREGELNLVIAKGRPQEMYNVADDPFELSDLLTSDQGAKVRVFADRMFARRNALLAT